MFYLYVIYIKLRCKLVTVNENFFSIDLPGLIKVQQEVITLFIYVSATSFCQIYRYKLALKNRQHFYNIKSQKINI